MTVCSLSSELLRAVCVTVRAGVKTLPKLRALASRNRCGKPIGTRYDLKTPVGASCECAAPTLVAAAGRRCCNRQESCIFPFTRSNLEARARRRRNSCQGCKMSMCCVFDGAVMAQAPPMTQLCRPERLASERALAALGLCNALCNARPQKACTHVRRTPCSLMRQVSSGCAAVACCSAHACRSLRQQRGWEREARCLCPEGGPGRATPPTSVTPPAPCR